MKKNVDTKEKIVMEKKQKIFIVAVVIVAIFILSAGIIFGYHRYQNTLKTIENVDENNQYVTILKDGTKENNSPKLKEKKVFDQLDITNIKLIEESQLTKLTATITNNTKSIKGDYTAEAVIVDSKGNELATMGIGIKKLAPGESTTLNSSIVFDYSNAYDIIFRK